MPDPYVQPNVPLSRIIVPEDQFVARTGRALKWDIQNLVEFLETNPDRWFVMAGSTARGIPQWIEDHPQLEAEIKGVGVTRVHWTTEVVQTTQVEPDPVVEPSVMVGEYPELATISAMESFRDRREREREEHREAELIDRGGRSWGEVTKKEPKEPMPRGVLFVHCDSCSMPFSVDEVHRLHNHTMERHKRPPTKLERTPRPKEQAHAE